MGNKLEVWIWIPDIYNPGSYRWESIYRGESWCAALYWASWAKRRKAGCVKIEWR